jgi:serine/threonine protein kinase
MAPEQIDGQIADARSDLFSLGVVLYQMITGSHPFLRGTMAATMSATCRGDYRPLCEIVPDAPKSLDTVLRRCLFVNPTMRMKSAAELIDALRPLTREESAPPPACSVAGAPRRAKTALSIARRLPGVVADVARLARAKDWRVAAARSVKSAWETVTGGNESSGGEAIEKYASFVNAGIRSGAGNSKKSVGSGFRKGAASPASGLAPRPTGNALVKNRSR